MHTFRVVLSGSAAAVATLLSRQSSLSTPLTPVKRPVSQSNCLSCCESPPLWRRGGRSLASHMGGASAVTSSAALSPPIKLHHARFRSLTAAVAAAAPLLPCGCGSLRQLPVVRPRAAHRRPRVRAHPAADCAGEGGADHGRRQRGTAVGPAAVCVVQRGLARRGACGSRHRLPHTSRAGRHLRHAAGAGGGSSAGGRGAREEQRV